jgi:hypothetical protein
MGRGARHGRGGVQDRSAVERHVADAWRSQMEWEKSLPVMAAWRIHREWLRSFPFLSEWLGGGGHRSGSRAPAGRAALPLFHLMCFSRVG